MSPCNLKIFPGICGGRAGVQVYSSPDADGQRRKYAGAVGSVVRRQFKKLPGVGSSTAKRWYDLGLR